MFLKFFVFLSRNYVTSFRFNKLLTHEFIFYFMFTGETNEKKMVSNICKYLLKKIKTAKLEEHKNINHLLIAQNIIKTQIILKSRDLI